jgi:hypothetical protein
MKSIGSWIPWCLIAAAQLCAAPLSAQRDSVPHWTPSLGAGLVVGNLPFPFVSTCSGDDVGSVGVQVHAGLQANSVVDLRARFAAVSDIDFVDCLFIPLLQPDGVHRLRDYDRSGDGLRAIDVQIGLTPPGLRFLRVSAGGGWELNGSQPFIVGGAGLNFGSRLRFIAGGDVLVLRSAYTVVDEEWRGARLIQTTRVSDGSVWKGGLLFHAGAEIR